MKYYIVVTYETAQGDRYMYEGRLMLTLAKKGESTHVLSTHFHKKQRHKDSI